MKRSTGYNTGLAKVEVLCSTDTFAFSGNSVLRNYIRAENSQLLVATNL